ncbi:hypothetical protein V3C99_002844 [Haemonchus contortus]
MPSTVLIKG